MDRLWRDQREASVDRSADHLAYVVLSFEGVLSRQAVLVLALTALIALVVGAAVVLRSRP